MTIDDIYVVRSDTGNGGWSLHLKGSEDEDGIAPVLVSGTADWIPDTDDKYGHWSRPNKADYEAALLAVSLG